MESPTLPESFSNRNHQAIQELIQGQESINNLTDLLCKPQKIEPSPILDEDGVVARILEIFENTLSIIKHSSCVSDGMHLIKPDENQSQVAPGKNKRRKRKTTWKSTQVTSVLVDDGYAWRKYGQKQILNFKHPRSYYRCTYKFDQGCLATKYVQKIQDNPSKYETTYIRNHTCNNLLRTPPIILDSMNPTDTSILLINFSTNRFIEPKNVDPSTKFVKHELDDGFPPLGDMNPNYLSPSFISHVPWEAYN
uniref:probable WRKY transcription factor 70 isoform X2 n=1 Tax=Erigeron canadensis TaxID=72917 RepID=UPI001CB9CB17|nr:probable WRKY transcription factor 70 isoform X2 [Erigeron canadensis]